MNPSIIADENKLNRFINRGSKNPLQPYSSPNAINTIITIWGISCEVLKLNFASSKFKEVSTANEATRGIPIREMRSHLNFDFLIVCLTNNS